MIQEEYVSFEMAQLLKDKGFNELCSFKYFNNRFQLAGYKIQEWQNSELDEDEVSAPTQQMAMRWLREKHKILIVLIPSVLGSDTLKWLTSIRTYDQNECFLEEQGIIGKFDSYEEACEIAIKSALEDLIR